MLARAACLALVIPFGGVVFAACTATPELAYDDALPDAAARDADADTNAPGADSPTCALPSGASFCCGAVVCVSNGGACAGHCEACQRCAGTRAPVCCVNGAKAKDVSCRESADDC